MDLAVAGDLRAVGAEHQGGVEQGIADPLADGTAVQGDAMPAGGGGEEAPGLAVPLGAGRGEGFGLRQLGGAVGTQAGPHFGQADQAGVLGGGRRRDERAGGGDVGGFVGAGLELDGGCSHRAIEHQGGAAGKVGDLMLLTSAVG